MTKFRVYHVPQIPMDGFAYEVPTYLEAARLSDALCKYDLFQFENKVKPDYSNISFIEFSKDGEEWESIDDHDDAFDMNFITAVEYEALTEESVQ